MQTSADILDTILRRERSPIPFTKAFRRLRHNDDLCPRLQLQVETTTRAFGKLRSITYDTQGIRDDGADIVHILREADEPAAKIAFQIKSYDDLEEKHWLRRLRAQYVDTLARVGDLKHLYIVLCTDHSAHMTKIRLVTSEFRELGKVSVVEPTYAWTFLTLPEHRIDAIVKRALDGSDAVVSEATSALADLGAPTAQALACYACAWALYNGRGFLSLDDLRTEPSIRQMYDEVTGAVESQVARNRDEFEEEDVDRFVSVGSAERIAEDIELICHSLFDVAPLAGRFRPDFAAMTPIVALLTDAIARYGLEWHAAAAYVAELVGVPQAVAPSEWPT